jgi:5'-3' exonuclease
MANDVILLIDISALAWQAFHTLPDLSVDSVGTGISYGILKRMLFLSRLYATNRFVWCLDSPVSLRRNMFPKYKAARKEKKYSTEEEESRHELFRQLMSLVYTYLPAMGFKNVFGQCGYEADDVIAAVISDNFRSAPFVIVSGDKDLFQLLKKDRVAMYNPTSRKEATEQSFRCEWGISPSLWWQVKTIAGCSTDSVPGVKGVGEKTAIKYLQGTLSEKKTAVIDETLPAFAKRNKKLVRLPFPGIKTFRIQEDALRFSKFKAVFAELGFFSFEQDISIWRDFCNGTLDVPYKRKTGRVDVETIRKQHIQKILGLWRYTKTHGRRS